MRVLSGKYKGKKLICTSDNSIRPTTNRIKEFIFNILQDFCEGKRVADFFCGTGNLGIESLSRGASNVVFIDSKNSSLRVLKKNLQELKIEQSRFEIVNSEANNFSREKGRQFDMIFMDPPFNFPPLNELINNIFNNQFLINGGILVVEHEITNPIEKVSNLYEIFKQKKIGRSLISFIINKRSSNV